MKPVTTATLLAPRTLVGVSRPTMITRPTCRVTRAVCCAALMLLGACFTTGPADNAGFARIKQLSDLDGVYENQGEGVIQVQLSELVWPDAADLDHFRIDRIEVRAVDADTLEVTAKDGSATVVKHGLFVEGKDFKISGGTIQLSRKVRAPPGDAEAVTTFLGLAYEDVDLGLDEAGHGKYRSGGVAGGLLFMFFPIAMGGSDEVRFNRMDE